jgi:LPS export ABC transporter protein LptC
MQTKIKHWLLIFFVVNCFVCKRQEPAATTPAASNGELPDQEGWKSTSIATSNGQTTAIIAYGHMKRYESQKMIYFDDGIAIDFFNEKGQHSSKLTSQKGKLDENTNNVEADEQVVAVSDSGVTLKTERLWWDNALEKVISDQFVTITTTEKDTFSGVGFESDQNLSNWNIKEFQGKTEKKLNFKLKNHKTKTQPVPKDTIR